MIVDFYIYREFFSHEEEKGNKFRHYILEGILFAAHTARAKKRGEALRACEISAAPRNYPDFRELCKLRYYEIQIESQKLDRMSLLRIWCRQYLPPGREST